MSEKISKFAVLYPLLRKRLESPRIKEWLSFVLSSNEKRHLKDKHKHLQYQLSLLTQVGTLLLSVSVSRDLPGMADFD